MPEILRLRPVDRVLVLAPHPDDESIACGGLLLATRDVAAARRVVVITDGDNNPWPQRWIEKRWQIDAQARARWGARRRSEAQTALDVLGVEPAQRFFFGLPDLGLTNLLMRDDQGLRDGIRTQLEEFQPNLVLAPVIDDHHPDHSALHVALRFALWRYRGTPPQVLTFTVHGHASGGDFCEVPLDESQHATKRQAILCHQTQIRLSGRRFLRFAESIERYRLLSMKTPAALQTHPLRAWLRDDGAVGVRIDMRRWRDGLHGHELLLAIDSVHGPVLRARLPLPRHADTTAAVQSSVDDAPFAEVRWQPEGESLVGTLRLRAPWEENGEECNIGYVKLEKVRRSLRVYDHFGWQPMDFPAANSGKTNSLLG